MDCSKVGELIYRLRTEKGMTQKNLADMLNISDKTVSKWERGLGCPDISLLGELSQALGVNIEEILAGDLSPQDKVRGNMKKTKFYVCGRCGNLITATGEAAVSCCGRKLEELTVQAPDEEHTLQIEPVEDEYFISVKHEMSKEHYLSFLSYVTGDKLLVAKLYPEQNAEVRFKRYGHGRLYTFCNRHGLFGQNI